MPVIGQSGDLKLPFSVLGRKFRTTAEAEAHFAAVKARREKLAGRTLTDREVYKGIEKPDTRTTAEKIEAANFRVLTGEQPKEDDNPFRSDDWRERHGRKEPETASQRQKRLEREWDAKQAERERLATIAADPARQALVASAEQALEFARFSPTTTFSDVVKAEQLLAVARAGDLDFAKSLASDLNTKVETDYSAQRQAAQKRLADARAAVESIPRPPSINPHLMPGDSVGRLADGRIEVLSAQREGEIGRRVRCYDPDTAPADIQAALGENQ
jgi:hypothetical protein